MSLGYCVELIRSHFLQGGGYRWKTMMPSSNAFRPRGLEKWTMRIDLERQITKLLASYWCVSNENQMNRALGYLCAHIG